jgi:hypothetical protein
LKVFYRLLTKKGFIFSLLFRYFNRCSSYQFFHAELEKFKKLLLQNGYPKFFIDRCVKTFLDKMISPPLKVQTPTVSKLLIPIVLPYTGNHGIQIRQQLHKLFSSAFPQVQLRVIFTPICRLSNFFHFKDRIPLNLRSHVVYQFECQCCNALYLGKTCRHLHTRISEHCGISALTGNPLSCVSKSSISDHSREAGHPIEPSDFKIVTSANSNHNILIKESLLIAQTKPWLNYNVRSFPLTLF